MPDPTRHKREQVAERIVRKITGLGEECGLRPAPCVYDRQDKALAKMEELIANGEYTRSQLGLFAREIGQGGKRVFMVDTFAGFALKYAPWDVERPGTEPDHLYEVIMETRPCWLYFDLEFSRPANPTLEPDTVISAFHVMLAEFCQEAIGAPLDESSVVELDSSTPQKFSKHVIVQRLCGQRHLAFANNAQAGLFVSEFLAFALARRSSHQDSPAKHLFVLAPPAANAVDKEMKEVSIVDESVYSRNRSFRLAFNTKFGKAASLTQQRSPSKPKKYPPLQLLSSMASFVPIDIPLFSHPLIPHDYCHRNAKVTRVLPAERTPREPDNGGSGASVRSSVHQWQQQSGLLQHLVETWDKIRKLNEPGVSQWRPTVVASVAEMQASSFLTVTLDNNRFCFGKGSSHLSNKVYLVVDKERGTFHQKCFDIDCRHFKSPPFQIPGWLLEEEREAAEMQNFSPVRQGLKRPFDSANTPEPVSRLDKRMATGAAVSHLPAGSYKSAWSQQQGGFAATGSASAMPDSDDELIGADPDEVAVAQGATAPVEGEDDWFDIDKLW